MLLLCSFISVSRREGNILWTYRTIDLNALQYYLNGLTGFDHICL